MTPVEKIALRRKFLAACAPTTQDIHGGIVDLFATAGRINPGVLGQSTVGFHTAAEKVEADRTRRSPYGGAEYGTNGPPEVLALAEKFAALHGGRGAVLTASGLGAITAVFDTFLPGGRSPSTVLIPDNHYQPAERALRRLARARPDLEWHKYPARGSGAEVAGLIDRLMANGRKVDMVYLEAPGSQTFEIPDIDGIVAAAKQRGIRTVMDNSWASHALFQPLAHGVNIAVQAATKYERGRGDTLLGAVIVDCQDDATALEDYLRDMGTGAVAPENCARVLETIDSTRERIDLQAATAARMMDWFDRQDFVETVLSPAFPRSPDHARFGQYFAGSNGIFSVVCKPHVTAAQVEAFQDNLMVPIIGASWGSHVTLVESEEPHRVFGPAHSGQVLRFSAGLEDDGDLLQDLQQAASATFPVRQGLQRNPVLT